MAQYMKRYMAFIAVLLVLSLVFIGCGATSPQQGGSQSGGTHTSTTTTSTGTTATVSCPPQKGLVIFGTEGCPHCRALKGYSHEVFGKGGTCFVEVNPAYGATKKAQEFFVKIYKEAYPGIPESSMGVPLAFMFYDGSVRGIFVGEVPTKTLASLEQFVSTSTKSVIVWNGQAYQLTATAADKLTQDIKGFFGAGGQ